MTRRKIPYASAVLLIRLRQMAAFVAANVAAAALAVAQAAPIDPHSPQGVAHAFAQAQLKSLGMPNVERAELEIEPLSSASLPACSQMEAFMPGTARLWGNSRVGVRCLEGAHWTVYLPAHVRLYGPALVLRRPLNLGQEVVVDDYQVQQTELTREQPGLLSDPHDLAGRITTRPLNVGAVLRSDQFRQKPVVLEGDLVKVVFVGSGFAVEGEGVATGAAAEGQPVRVKVESGRVISGTAHDGRRVEVR